MPAPSLKSMAKRAGVSYEDAERYWDDSKQAALDQGFTEGEDDFYAYVMGIVKRRMGLAGILQVAAVETETRQYKITGDRLTLDRLERLMYLLEYNSAVGHSSPVGMSIDGDGADTIRISPSLKSKYRKGAEKITGVGWGIEMATDRGYSGMHTDWERTDKSRGKFSYDDNGKQK